MIVRSSWRGTVRAFFGTPLNSVLTLGSFGVLAWIVPGLFRWAVWEATWTGDADACRMASGACWAFIGEKIRVIAFGLYPSDDQSGPGLALLLLAGLLAASAHPRFWRPWLLWGWGAGLLAAIGLMLTGDPTRPGWVATDRWGGVSLTVLATLLGLGLAFPLAVLLALARRSRLGGVRTVAVVFIEVLRGVPMIAVLYTVTLVLPLALPSGAEIDKLLRAQIGIALFAAAYLAEIIRAGLQSVAAGQREAALALGLSRWQALRLVILPQALCTVIPSLVTLAIGLLQDTTLLIVIGLFDFLNGARTAATDPNWLGFYSEAFAFAALLYFLVCFTASRYSLWLERRLRRGYGP